ncbi:MAG: PD-(D/E)XK nuclease family protein, partial [Treponema sp.]
MYEKLLKDFSLVPKKQEKDATFLEICGLSSNENISSNILSFFFDSEREHKLKDLFANSLIKIIIEKTNKDIIYSDICFHCAREVVTKNNKRIDLLITNKDITILIENKIWAPLYNDLDEYFEHIKDYKTPYGVVLSLSSIPDEKQKPF